MRPGDQYQREEEEEWDEETECDIVADDGLEGVAFEADTTREGDRDEEEEDEREEEEDAEEEAGTRKEAAVEVDPVNPRVA